MTAKRDKYQHALYELVLELPLATRRRCEPNIKLLQNILNDDTDLFSDRRGKHWAERRVEPQLSVEIRGQGSQNMSYQEASQLIRRSPKQLQMAISIGRGIAHFKVDDNVVLVQRL